MFAVGRARCGGQWRARSDPHRHGRGRPARLQEHDRATAADVIAQDEATSVVWGMPGQVGTGRDLPAAILPLDQIGRQPSRKLFAGEKP